jgi:hypothetical protein
MRFLSLASLLLVSCTVRVPQTPGLKIAVRARVDANVHIEPPRPPPPPPAVELEDAPVVEFFGIPLEGVADVIFVLDRSGSMDEPAAGRIAQLDTQPAPPADPQPPPPPEEPPPAETPQPVAPAPPRKIDVARAELIDALMRLPEGTRVNIIFFNDELEALAVSMVTLDEPGRADAIGFVQAAVADGRTALAPAMRTAFLMNAQRIVLLSDGLGNVGGNARSILRDAREAARGGVRIDTIGIGVDQDAELLGALAAESGGLYQPL